MRTKWIVGITLFVMVSIISILVFSNSFDGWLFFGMVFYVFLFFGGYMFIMYGRKAEQTRLEEEARIKQKFDWCWNRVNVILRRMAGVQGLEWSSGMGRKSEYRTYYDGVQNHAYRSMMGFLSNTQQLAVVIYDIDRDDIVRFVTNPDVMLLENHFRNFRPFGKSSYEYTGIGGQYNKYSRYEQQRGVPVSINVGGEPQPQPLQPIHPDDVTVDSALKKVRE